MNFHEVNHPGLRQPAGYQRAGEDANRRRVSPVPALYSPGVHLQSRSVAVRPAVYRPIVSRPLFYNPLFLPATSGNPDGRRWSVCGSLGFLALISSIFLLVFGVMVTAAPLVILGAGLGFVGLMALAGSSRGCCRS